MALEDAHRGEPVAHEDAIARQPQDLALPHLRHEERPDAVDQRDSRFDQDQRPEVRIPAADRRGGIDHRRHAGGHQAFCRHSVEILVIDHGDVPGLGPGHEVLGASIDTGDPGLPPTFARPAARSPDLGRGRVGLLFRSWPPSGPGPHAPWLGRVRWERRSCAATAASHTEGSPHVRWSRNPRVPAEPADQPAVAPREADAVARSSSACVTAPSLPVRPASMRDNSWMRSSSESTRTVAVPDPFSTRM